MGALLITESPSLGWCTSPFVDLIHLCGVEQVATFEQRSVTCCGARTVVTTVVTLVGLNSRWVGVV